MPTDYEGPIKILLIAPYLGLIKLFEEAVYQRNNLLLTSFECDTVHVPELMKSIDLNDYDFVISRGYTCKMVQECCSSQVFDVGISIYDAFRVIRLARDYSGKIAIVGFKSVIYYASMLKEMLAYSIDIFTITKIDEIEKTLEHLKSIGYTMIIGDVITSNTAKQLGLQSMLITTSPESVESILNICETTYKERIHLRRQNKFISELIANSTEDLIVFTSEGKEVYKNHILPRELLLSIKKNIDFVVKNNEHIFVKTAKEYRYFITGKTLTINHSPYIVFFCQKKKKINKKDPLITYHNKDEYKDISQRIFFTQNVALRNLLLSIESFNYLSRPVIISGPRGIGKDQFAFYLYEHCSRLSTPMVIIDCSYATTITWLNFLNKEDSPIYFNNYTIYFKNLHALSAEQQDQLINCIQATNLVSRNQLIFSYSTDSNITINNCRLLDQLYNTMNALCISVPALKDRREDILNYATLYLNEFNTQLAKQVVAFDPEALEILHSYTWPGNLYQMRRVIQELILSSDSLIVTGNETQLALNKSEKALQDKSGATPLTLEGTLDNIIDQAIQTVLKEEQQNQTKAALRLGISRSTLRRHLKA